MTQDEKRDKIYGCFLGLAVGDALGAPVEFLTLSEIQREYGPNGITDFMPWDQHPPGSYTDDTQMSLATAQGILDFFSQDKKNPVKLFRDPREAVYNQYLKWLKTQSNPEDRRRPGITCLQALSTGKMGDYRTPLNTSKGCGAVMRSAPLGLVFEDQLAFYFGTETGVLTHGSPAGYFSAGFHSLLISLLLQGNSMEQAVQTAAQFELASKLHPYASLLETWAKIKEAVELAKTSLPPEKAIEQIGEGWTGHEALAISLYCCLKFPESWSCAVLAAVNHSGDSDSTGSITGGLQGVRLGLKRIPEKWVHQVENSKEIQKIAEAFYKLYLDFSNS